MSSDEDQAQSYWCRSEPNVPRVWSYSSFSTLADCPRRFQYAYVEGWTSRRQALAPTFGTYFHECMSHFQLRLNQGAEREEALIETARLARFAGEFFEIFETNRNRETLFRTVVDYLDRYESDPAKVLLVQDKAASETYFSLALPLTSPDGDNYILHGYVDEIRHLLEPSIWDYKTTAQELNDWYFEQFDVSAQIDVYLLGLKTIRQDMDIHQVIIDAVQTLVKSSKFARRIYRRDDSNLAETIRDIVHWIRFAEQCAQQNYWPKNTKACRFCQFKEICPKKVEMREVFLRSDFNLSRRVTIDRPEEALIDRLNRGEVGPNMKKKGPNDELG